MIENKQYDNHVAYVLPSSLAANKPAATPRYSSGQHANCEHLTNINSLPMVVDIAPQTKLATYTGLYSFASTSAAVLGPFIAGLLIDALGKDYSVIFAIAAVMFAIAFVSCYLSGAANARKRKSQEPEGVNPSGS